MNRKTLLLNTLAATLLLGAGTAQAASLDEVIRAQTLGASAAIRAEARHNLKTMPYVLDIDGVEVGNIELVESTAKRPGRSGRAQPQDMTAVDSSEALRRDLVTKALSAPGMFGVYRYMAATALTAAIIVAE